MCTSPQRGPSQNSHSNQYRARRSAQTCAPPVESPKQGQYLYPHYAQHVLPPIPRNAGRSTLQTTQLGFAPPVPATPFFPPPPQPQTFSPWVGTVRSELITFTSSPADTIHCLQSHQDLFPGAAATPPSAQQLVSYPNRTHMIQQPVQRTNPPLRLISETWPGQVQYGYAPVQAAGGPQAFLPQARS